MFLYFPYPNNRLLDASSTFMSFPITDKDGYVVFGVIGSVLFIFSIILLVYSMEKYKGRTFIIAIVGYVFLQFLLITTYQETFAKGIYAISYDGNGNCNFETVEEGLIEGECNFVLHNRSNKPVTFELQFIDIDLWDGETRFESLMNIAGPIKITIEANRKKSIHLKELLDVSDVPNRIDSGTSSWVHFKLIDGEHERIL